MRDLIERIEAATGPDRELDAEIFRAIGAPAPFQFMNKLIALEYNDQEQAYFARVSDDMHVKYSPPAYTASIDAAMTLVPEGVTYVRLEICARGKHGQHCRTSLEWLLGDVEEERESGHGLTAPLALCAAALRARNIEA